MAGLYIHIPYCHAKCAYCDFYSLPRHDEAEALMAALRSELHARRSELRGEAVRTVYIGGGTPSILEPEKYAWLALEPEAATVEEFTFEANPEDVGAEMALKWRELGANRASVGVQSLREPLLREIGRRHSAKDALRAIATLQRCGIANVSADLIYGLPGQTCAEFREDVERLADTGITHLSAYCLQWEQGTRLYARRAAGKCSEADEDTLAQMYADLCEVAAEHGLEHYEISNFGKAGFHSRHNSAYWNLTPYLGLGPSAHSFDGRTRRVNPASVKEYLRLAPEAFEAETENVRDLEADLIFTSLRTTAGLDTKLLRQSTAAGVLARARRFESEGIVEAGDGRVCIPPRHFLIADSIIRELLPE